MQRVSAVAPFVGVLLVSLLFVWGCFPGAGPNRTVNYYTLDYAPPVSQGQEIGHVVKFDRFSSARSYDNASMFYKPAAYQLIAYNYSKWRTTPGDMVTDYLLRDFRQSGLFRAVFSYRQPESARFVIGGGIEEFVEEREADKWNVVLGMYVTLLDMSQPEVTNRVVFQKRYRVAEPIDRESPESFASGMSGAMARISALVMGDVKGAIGKE